MKTKILLVALFSIVLTGAFAQESEKRFGIELNGGASMLVNKLDESTLNPGFGFEGILHFRVLEHTGIYGGWGWNRLGAEESFAGDHVSFEETGYILGLQFKHPFGSSAAQFYLRAGGLYSHIETDNLDGETINDTKHGLGWQLAAGIDLPMYNNWSFTPGIKFNSLSRESDFEGITREMNHNYLSLRIGFLKSF